MKSNKYLLQQTGQNYIIRDSRGVTTKIGDLATNGQDGADGLSVLTGSGDPSAGIGRDGEIYIDINNFKLFNKSAGSWNAGSLFKGTDGNNGNDGARGKTTLQGAGAPGTGANLGTATAALSDALTDAGLTSGDLQAGDLYLDTTNHAFYKKTSSGWATRGTTFRPQKFKGLLSSLSDSGDEGDSAIFNNLVYTRSGGAWSSTGASTKGDKGDSGDPGDPGVDGNGVYSTTSIASGATPSDITAYGSTKINDILIDSTNHKIYKRGSTASPYNWVLQGSQFRGAVGADGPAAISGYLSNESHSVGTNPDGTGFDLTDAGGTFYIFSGSTAITAQNYYVGATGTSTSKAQNKLTLSVNSSGAYTLSGASWSSDSESFTLRALSGSFTVTKSYNIVKNKSAKNLRLVTNTQTFTKNGAGSFYPSGQSITLTPSMQNLSNTTISWSLSKILGGTVTSGLSITGDTNITITTGASPYATITSAQFNTATGGVIGTQLRVTATHADGVSDTVTLQVVSDGAEADIYCATLGTAANATDQLVPYDSNKGGGTGLRLSDVKANVGGIITAAEETSVSYTSVLQDLANPPSTSYTFTYNVAGTNYTDNVINHRADNIGLTYVPTIFTVAVAGQYRITWQGSFRIRNYDPNNGRSTTCYMSLLKCAAGSSTYDVVEEISAALTATAAGTEQSTPTWTTGGTLSSIVRILSVKPVPQAANALTVKDYIANYNSDYEYTTKVTTLKLSVGDKIMFKARKNSYAIVSYYPEDVYSNFYGTNSLKYRDAHVAYINANSTSDDETDKDIDTIVMFQKIAD